MSLWKQLINRLVEENDDLTRVWHARVFVSEPCLLAWPDDYFFAGYVQADSLDDALSLSDRDGSGRGARVGDVFVTPEGKVYRLGWDEFELINRIH